jgi:hypothetical protein
MIATRSTSQVSKHFRASVRANNPKIPHREGKRFVVRADEKLSAFVELERQVLTVTFYLASIRAGDQ